MIKNFNDVKMIGRNVAFLCLLLIVLWIFIFINYLCVKGIISIYQLNRIMDIEAEERRRRREQFILRRVVRETVSQAIRNVVEEHEPSIIDVEELKKRVPENLCVVHQPGDDICLAIK